ncbi:hypothetical protein BLNAU_18504 [Blattamonas nauphoetae]|uniref:Uncharacterized protein n=1 Tax=Blattamonas nauphoetae TaxID=2049346 RepID=A0ABQ9X485_9EUKA|nr:hypothetical protein BLNAU_18504 [Blattamonas nauphoetae]
MLPEPHQNISKVNDKETENQPTIESVLELLRDSSVHPRNKVNSFQWFSIPSLLTNHIQSQQRDEQAPSTDKNPPLISSLLQLIFHCLKECSNLHTPVPNKRILQSSLYQLVQSSSLPPSVRQDADLCLTSLRYVDEGLFALVETSHLDLIELKDRTIAEQQNQLVLRDQQIATHAKLEHELVELRTKEQTFLSTLNSQQLEENERVITEQKQTIQQIKTEIVRKEQFFPASDVIVAFSEDKFRVTRSTVTRINSEHRVGCFTKPVSTGIHRLSIKTEGAILIGVLDADEHPNHLTSYVSKSPKAAMMYNNSGYLKSAGKELARNTKPQKGQEWSAEADLEKRTLHFFIDSVQQQHHFINIPVPLVFALDVYTMGDSIEITFWGELKQSQVTFQGTGHNLG